MADLRSAVNASISGIRSVTERMASNSQNLAAAGAIASKSREVFVTANNLGNNLETYIPAGVATYGEMMNTVVGAPIDSPIATHFAIQGQGYTVVSNQGAGSTQDALIGFTRVGTFKPDQKGDFKNHEGQYLMVQYTHPDGTPILNDVSTTNGLRVASIQGLTGTPNPTTSIATNVTLPATAYVNDTVTTEIPIMDSLGNTHIISVLWEKTAQVNGVSQTWQASISSSDAVTIGTPYDAGDPTPFTIVFDNHGLIHSMAVGVVAVASPPALNVTWNNAAAGSAIALNFGAVGQPTGGVQCNGNVYGEISIIKDGNAAGRLLDVSLSSDGYLNATFDNSETRRFARVPIATFKCPNQLNQTNGGVYFATADSGAYQLNSVGQNGAGNLVPGKTEGSTIDSASIFTKIIMDQNENMGDLQAIKAVNEMLKSFEMILR